MEISFSTCEERIVTINLPQHIKNFGIENSFLNIVKVTLLSKNMPFNIKLV